MENSILNGEVLNTLDSGVYNFIDVNLVIPEKYLGGSTFKEVNLSDNEKIENIAYNEYGDSKYWDLIMIYNGMRSALDIPRDINYVEAEADRALNRWKKQFEEYDWCTSDYVDNKREELVTEMLTKNELHRTIRIPNQSLLFDLVADLKEQNNDTKQ